MWLLWLDLGILIGLFLAAMLTMAKEDEEQSTEDGGGVRDPGWE